MRYNRCDLNIQLLKKITISCPVCGRDSLVNTYDGQLIGYMGGCAHFGMIPAFAIGDSILFAPSTNAHRKEEENECLSKKTIKKIFAIAKAKAFIDVAHDLTISPENLEAKIINAPSLYKETGIYDLLDAWQQTRGMVK